MTLVQDVRTGDPMPADAAGVSIDDGVDETSAADAPGRPSRGGMAVAGTALCILAAVLLSLVAELTFVGALKHARDQQVEFAEFRKELAEGTAPTGQVTEQGALLAPGSTVALLKIPALGVDEVVAFGTTSTVTASGPGLRRDTVFPGQPGTAVVFGRQAAYGGPFGDLERLAPGDRIDVTTGQGEFAFRVTGLRLPGDPAPQPLAAGRSRITLVTAFGDPYVPTTTLRVDAELEGEAADPSARVLTATALAPAELPLAGDPSAWVPLVFWAQGLLLASAGFVLLLRRWGRWQAWVVGVPLVALSGLGVAQEMARLLPNLL